MILADENIHGYIIETLRKEGFEVVSVAETASSIKDNKVIELALQLGYLLLTEDKDFGEWVFAHHVKNLSVLFLRYSFEEYAEIKKDRSGVVIARGEFRTGEVLAQSTNLCYFTRNFNG